MNRNKPITAFIIFINIIICNSSLSAQNPVDTLACTKNLLEKGLYKSSVKLIKPFYKNHPGNLTAQWLYGQANYDAGNYKTFQTVYENAIAWHPENYYLRLDFSLKLIKAGFAQKGIPFLYLYLKYDSAATSVHDALAIIDYWKGDYISSKKEIKKVLKKEPSNKDMIDLSHKINIETSPWIKFSTGFNFDDQPMSVVQPEIEAGMYSKKWGFLDLSFQSFLLNVNPKNYSANQIKLGSSFGLNHGNNRFSFHVGVANLPDHSSKIIGDISDVQKISQTVSIEAKAEHTPYLLTRSSVESPIMMLHYNVGANLVSRHHWEAKIFADINHFYTDSNLVWTIGGWIYSPYIQFSKFVEARMGYAYSYANSKHSQFVSSVTGIQAYNEWLSKGQVDGFYSLYFTPNRTNIHSLLSSILIHVNKENNIGIKANIGISAKTQSPFLMMTDSTGNINSVKRGYAEALFNPCDISVYWASQLSSRSSLKLEYKYFSTYFYTGQYAGISLMINFLNEKN